MGDIDKSALRVLVFEKTGIKIDESDPAFAVAVMAEAVLTAAAREAGETLGEAVVSKMPSEIGPFFSKTEEKIGETFAKMEQLVERFDGRLIRFLSEAARLEKMPLQQLSLDIKNSYTSRDAAVYSIKQAIEEHNKMIATLKETATRIEKAKLYHALTLFAATLFAGAIGGVLSAAVILH